MSVFDKIEKDILKIVRDQSSEAGELLRAYTYSYRGTLDQEGLYTLEKQYRIWEAYVATKEKSKEGDRFKFSSDTAGVYFYDKLLNRCLSLGAVEDLLNTLEEQI